MFGNIICSILGVALQKLFLLHGGWKVGDTFGPIPWAAAATTLATSILIMQFFEITYVLWALFYCFLQRVAFEINTLISFFSFSQTSSRWCYGVISGYSPLSSRNGMVRLLLLPFFSPFFSFTIQKSCGKTDYELAPRPSSYTICMGKTGSSLYKS